MTMTEIISKYSHYALVLIYTQISTSQDVSILRHLFYPLFLYLAVMFFIPQ